jgi:hypothetical protein
MATPTRSEIEQYARQIYVTDQFRRGCPKLGDINPTVEELKESGCWSQAISELMLDNARSQTEQYEGYIQETENFAEKQVVSELPFDITEAKDTGWFSCGTSQSGKTTLNKHIVDCLLRQGFIVDVLDVSRAWAYDSPLHEVITIPHNGTDIDIPLGRSVVLDMSQLSFLERKRFVNAFVEVTYRAHMIEGYKRAPFRFILFEEAQTYFFNGCFRSPKSYSAPIDLVTVGANYNIRFGLITQFPALVDKAPVKIAQQRYFGWSTEKNDLDYIRKFIGKDWLSEIKSLQKGEFLYQLRNKITKFSIEPYGSASISKQSGFNYQMVYAL